MRNGNVWVWNALADRVHGACLDGAVAGFLVRCGESEVARVEVDSFLLLLIKLEVGLIIWMCRDTDLLSK